MLLIIKTVESPFTFSILKILSLIKIYASLTFNQPKPYFIFCIISAQLKPAFSPHSYLLSTRKQTSSPHPMLSFTLVSSFSSSISNSPPSYLESPTPSSPSRTCFAPFAWEECLMLFRRLFTENQKLQRRMATLLNQNQVS